MARTDASASSAAGARLTFPWPRALSQVVTRSASDAPALRLPGFTVAGVTGLAPQPTWPVLGWLSLACVCLVEGAFLKLPEAIETPGSDTGMYATYGQLLLHAARPYVDFWDLHPPLVYAYWALVEAVTGPDWARSCLTLGYLAPQSCTGVAAHALDLVLSLASALVVAALVRRMGESAAVAALAAVLVVGFADQALFSGEGSNPSKLTLLPSALAVWAYVRSLDSTRAGWWSVAAGLACGVAALAKQPALLTLLGLAGYAAWHRHRTGVVGLLIGCGSLLAGVCLVLALLGSLPDFVAQVWVYNVQRILVGYFQHPAKAPTVTLARVLTEGGAILAVLALAGGVAVARAPDRPRQRILLWWAGVNLAAVLVFREFVYVVPGLAAIGAYGFAGVWRWMARGRAPRATLGRYLLVAVCVLAIVPTTAFQRGQMNRARFERGPGGVSSQPEELGRILRREIRAGPLFVYGNAGEMYPLSGRMPATRYLNAEAWRSTAPGVDDTRADLVAALRRNPPPVILIAPHSDEAELNLASYASMSSFFESCYRPEPIDAELDRNWTVLVATGSCQATDSTG